jgi:hypothetical protein
MRPLRFAFLALFLLFALAAPAESTGVENFARAQTVSSSHQSGNRSPETTRHIVNVNEVRDEAKDLVAIADSIPAQIDQVAKGQLPANLTENLKKIEKLSKRIRVEVAPN